MSKLFSIILLGLAVISCGYGGAAYVFAPEDLSKPIIDDTPILTISGGCIDCIESDLRNAKGLDHLIVGYTGGTYALPTRKDFRKGRPGHNVSLQIYFSPSLHSTEDLIRIFARGIHKQSKKERQRWVAENGHDLIFYAENSDQSRNVNSIMKKANANLPKEKQISYQIRQADTFWVAHKSDQRFFNTYKDVIREEEAHRLASRGEYSPKISKLERLRNKNSIFNLNTSN